MEIINTSEFAWFISASFALVMVYRHIMQRMTDMKRAFQQDMRESYDSFKTDLEYIHQRDARFSDRLDAIEAKMRESKEALAKYPSFKEKAPYNGGGHYNTEA